MKMTQRLREMMDSDEVIVHPGIHDAMSAQIAENVGFKMVSMGGTSLGLHLGFGEPRVNLGDLVCISRYITQAINIPLKVDAGPGFGSDVQLVRTIKELEKAGVAACHIEDGVFPQRATHYIGLDPVISTEEMIYKIKVAVQARTDPDFVIIGRSSAMSNLGFAEGVRRANLYLEAGADAVYVFPNTMEEAKLAPREINGYVAFNVMEGGAKPQLSVEQAGDMGYKFVQYAVLSTPVSAIAIKKSMEYLMETGKTGLDKDETGEIMKYLLSLVGMDRMIEMELLADKRKEQESK